MKQEIKVISKLALYTTSKNIDGEIMHCIKDSDVKEFAQEIVKFLNGETVKRREICPDWIHEERVKHNDDNYCPICGKRLKDKLSEA